MLGDSREQEAAAFRRRLYAGPWTTPDVQSHEGYARDRFYRLLSRESEPPELGTIGRALERLTWNLWRVFGLLQAQRFDAAATL